MKTVVVFGGSGFVGCHVAKAFRRAGYAVWAASRSGARSTELLQAEVTPITMYEVFRTDDCSFSPEKPRLIRESDNPETFQTYIEKADIIVDATMGDILKQVVDTTISVSQRTNQKKILLMTGPHKGFSIIMFFKYLFLFCNCRWRWSVRRQAGRESY